MVKRYAALLLGLIAAFALSTEASRAQCTLPGAPGLGTPDSTFNAYFTENGPGWTGGDGSFSMPLPDGTGLWMWSDSYIGTVNPATRKRSSDLFTAHNSLIVLNTTADTFTTVGYPPKTSSYFAPSNKADWYWVGDGLVQQVAGGGYQITMVLQEFTTNFKFLGDAVATLSWPDYTILSIVPIALPNLNIEWGARLFQSSVDGYYYLYGVKDATSKNLPYLARFNSLSDLTTPSSWTYWNANRGEWLSGQSNATALSGVVNTTNDYTVDELAGANGTFYLFTTMNTQTPPYPDWKYVTTYYSCSPQGPWTTQTVVYTAPEAGAPGCKTGNLYTYNPRAHAEYTDSSGILVTYNVNALKSADLVCANDYMPRFIRVPIPGLITPASSAVP